MKPRRGPVVLVGPPLEMQPWIAADVELIRNYLEDKYGLVGVVYQPASWPTANYLWTAVGLA